MIDQSKQKNQGYTLKSNWLKWNSAVIGFIRDYY